MRKGIHFWKSINQWNKLIIMISDHDGLPWDINLKVSWIGQPTRVASHKYWERTGPVSFLEPYDMQVKTLGIDLDTLLAECDATPERGRRYEVAQKRGASKVEVYGFVAWVTSGALYFAFLMWALLPDEVLESLGVTYYPDKHWALAIPTWLCLFVACTFIGYESLVKMRAVPPASRLTLEDTTPQWTWEEVLARQGGGGEVLVLKDIPPVLATKLLFRYERRLAKLEAGGG